MLLQVFLFLHSFPGKRVSALTLPTIWHVPDELWQIILPLLDELDSPRKGGRRRIPPRPLLEAIIFRLRTGCQWNHLPKAFPE